MLKTENTLLLVVDFQERMMPVIHDSEALLERSAKFIKGCKLLGVTTLVTQQYTKGLGSTVPQISEALGEFEPFEKVAFSCYMDDGIKEKIDNHRKAGKSHILVTGVEAHICVQQTVLNLLDADYNVYLIADCTGSRKTSDFDYARRRMAQAGAVVTTLESALFEMMLTAEHPGRKEISALVK
ncbi:MAG: hydrolase [Oscillospiraceae bacterium]|nr:hydrolase [Oscillospiraceae bacterium]MCL2278414.1 hydrolase [Oscillospiraceae bacterium]